MPLGEASSPRAGLRSLEIKPILKRSSRLTSVLSKMICDIAVPIVGGRGGAPHRRPPPCTLELLFPQCF